MSSHFKKEMTVNATPGKVTSEQAYSAMQHLENQPDADVLAEALFGGYWGHNYDSYGGRVTRAWREVIA